MKKPNVTELDQLYKDSEAVDRAHCAEVRTNICLYAGQHYKGVDKKYLNRVLDSVSKDTKLKLQENHIAKICDRKIARLVSSSITIVPDNENELADQKDAELTLAVVKDDQRRINFQSVLEKHANAFIVEGETASFHYWDPYAGKQIGFEQEVNSEGEPMFIHGLTKTPTTEPGMIGAMGEPIEFEPMQSERPVFEGELKWEIVHGYNLKRHKAAETIEESPYIVIDKLVSKSEALLLIDKHPNKEELSKSIESSSQRGFKVFDGSNGEYVDSDDQVLLKYWLFRPCYDYPKGYFAIQCEGILPIEDELPFGIWSFAYSGMRMSSGSPRGKSTIRNLRHPQVELNRLVSQAAYHTIAFGDDKLVTQTGSKLTLGQTFNGIRHFMVAPGSNPMYLQGRDGAQFEGQIARQVKTIYDLGEEEDNSQTPGQQDPNAMLYQKLSQKERFNHYLKKFESFLVESYNIRIKLLKRYLSDDTVIKAVGRREAVNIAEFKNVTEEGYRVSAESTNTDVDSLFGKSLQIQMLLQYAGKDLPNSVKARLARMMPFMNEEQIFDELLIDDENIDSDILALDRGEQRPALKDDNHEIYIKRLTHRMKQNDFRLLPPQIQQLYDAKRQQHEQMKAQNLQELQEQQMGFIPSGGALVKCDLYGNDGKRMTMPYEALKWLEEKLGKQGMAQADLQMLQEQQQIDILKAINEQSGMGQAVGMQQPGLMPPTPA